MQFSIHTQHYDSTPELQEFVREHIVEPLDRLWGDSRAAELEVHLRDLRGSKGGLDKECRLVFRFQRAASMVITEVTEDMRTSVYQARRRLLRRARQELDRRTRGGARWPRKQYAARMVNSGSLGDPTRIPASSEVAGRETLH